MPLFGRKPKRPQRRPKKTLQQIYTDAINTEFRKNPELLKRVAFKEAGHADLLEAEDPIVARERDIKKKMLDRAFAKIDADPELIDRFTAQQIETLIGAPKVGESGEYDDRSPIQQLLQELDYYDELKKRMGGSQETGLGKYVDKNVILEALRLFQGATAAKVQETRYVIQVDGQKRTVSESEFQKLATAGKLMPIAAIASPEVVPTIVTTTPSPELPLVAPDSELPEVLRGINFEELIQLLDKSPREVTEMLTNDARGQLLLTVLGNMTYDTIVEKLSPYREHNAVGSYVQRVLDPKTKPWAEELLRIVKELGYGDSTP